MTVKIDHITPRLLPSGKLGVQIGLRAYHDDGERNILREMDFEGDPAKLAQDPEALYAECYAEYEDDFKEFDASEAPLSIPEIELPENLIGAEVDIASPAVISAISAKKAGKNAVVDEVQSIKGV